MSIEPAVSRFEGARIRFDSPLGFDRVLERLRAAITPLPLAEFNKVVAASDSQEAFEAAMGRCVGASGFVLFGEIDHGAWIAKYGIRRRALRWIFGNPLIAITMLRHDLQAGLFVPIELLLLETEDQRRCSVDRKSTRLNSSHSQISYAVFCLKKKKKKKIKLCTKKKKKKKRIKL